MAMGRVVAICALVSVQGIRYIGCVLDVHKGRPYAVSNSVKMVIFRRTPRRRMR